MKANRKGIEERPRVEHDDVEPTDKARAAREKRAVARKDKLLGWCAKCKARTAMKNPHEVTVKNGRKAVEGNCPKCSSRMVRMGRLPGAEADPASEPDERETPAPGARAVTRREASTLAPKADKEEADEVLVEVASAAGDKAGSAPSELTDPYDDPVLYGALQDRVRLALAEGATASVKKEGRWVMRVPGGGTHGLGDKEAGLPSPPTTSARAAQAIKEVFAEHEAKRPVVALPSADAEQIAGEPAKSLQQQPFIAEQVAQAVWVNRAYTVIGRVAVQVLMNTRLVSGQEMLAALKEPVPTTYIALVSSGLQVMEQNIKDPDNIVRLQSEVYEKRRNIDKMKVLLRKVLASAESVKAELLRRNENLKRDVDLAVALMRPQERLEYFRQRAAFAVAMSPRAGNGHPKEAELPATGEGEQ